LFSTSSRNKRHGETNVFNKAKSVKEAFLEEALGLFVVANKRERKKRSGDEQRDYSWWRKGYLNWNDKALQG